MIYKDISTLSTLSKLNIDKQLAEMILSGWHQPLLSG